MVKVGAKAKPQDHVVVPAPETVVVPVVEVVPKQVVTITEKPTVVASTEISTDPSQPAPVATQAKKPEKELVPKDWQRVETDNNGKSKLIDVMNFMGEQTDYFPGFKVEYNWPNLDAVDGFKRVVTAKFPKNGTPDQHEVISVFGYNLSIDKYGNSAVCFLSKDEVVEVENPETKAIEKETVTQSILEYVSLATVIDVLQDELNPKDEDGKGTCTVPWGTIDQVIKHKRKLKSRIKNLGTDDLPLSSRGRKKTETVLTVPISEVPIAETPVEQVAQPAGV